MRGRKLSVLIGILIAQAGPAQSPDWRRAELVSVELSSFKYSPSTLTLRQGTPYRLRLSNSSSGGHDFVAKDFLAVSTVAAEDGAKIHKGKIDVDGGESVEVRLVPNRAGSFEVHCSHFMHSGFGMTGTIIVR